MPQKGDVRKSRKRKEKKKTKEGEKVAPAKARFRVPTMVSGFGAIFPPVASGTVIVCKNNTRVLGSPSLRSEFSFIVYHILL